MIRGIDVSDNNGHIDPNLLKLAGLDFAAVKATEGTDYTNKVYQQQLDACRAAGLIIIHYHFARFDLGNEPQQEADYFVDSMLRQPGEPVALDVETGTDQINNKSIVFLQRCEEKGLPKPFLYSGAWYMYPNGLHDNAILAQYGLWFETMKPTVFPNPIPSWPFVAIWQYGQGNIPGIDGMVDLDLFNGTREQLAAYGK